MKTLFTIITPRLSRIGKSTLTPLVILSLVLNATTFLTPNSTVVAQSANDLSQRYVIFLNGINSFSPGSPPRPLNGDFQFIEDELRQVGITRFVYFSYGAAAALRVGDLYCASWENGCSTTSLGDLAALNLTPIYEDDDTRLSINLHVDALNWLLGQIITRDPLAQIDLVGFSLGGIVSSYWASRLGGTSLYRNNIHSLVLINSPVGGIPLARECLPGGLPSIICPVLRNQFGEDVLRQLQLPENTPDSIVDELPQAARNFPLLTSIQSAADYNVNDLPLQIFDPVVGFCLLGCFVPIGQGSQDWGAVGARHTQHFDRVLDNENRGLASVLLILISGFLKDRHNSALQYDQTAAWVIDALRAVATPTRGTISISAVAGQFFANPTNSGAFTATPADPVVFSQSFPVINFNPPAGTVPCSNATGVGVNTRPFTAVVPQPDSSCTTIVAEGNGQQAGLGSLFDFEAVFRGSFVVSAASQVTFNFFSDDGWILSIGPNPSGAQPSYVSGPLINRPSAGPFSGYSVVGSYNQPSPPTRNDLVVNFPAAGTYPFELDYTECCAGELALTLTANSQPIPAGGSISGSVYNGSISPGNAVAAALVQVCEVGGQCSNTLTSASGQYTVSGLAAGQYNVTAFPPGTSDLLQGTVGPVNLAASTSLTGQNIILTGPTPPPAGTTITNRGTGGGGLPIVYWAEPLSLTSQGCAGGAASYQILQNGVVVRSGTMTEGSTGSYSATVSPLFPAHGNARVLISIQCSGGNSTTTSFDIYIDPSGFVTTVEGFPIAGAIVTLYRSESASGPFEAVPNGSGIMSFANRNNPTTSDVAGRFGWDVVAGYYRVRAAKPGCVSPSNPSQDFVESEVLTIPPAVTNAYLRLACPLSVSSDLVLTKSDDPDPVTAGQSLTYTLAIRNNGPSDATGVTVTDTLPANVAFVSATSSQGTCSQTGGSVTCNLASLTNGTTAGITIVVAPAGGCTITNSANVTGNEADPNTANNTATATTMVHLDNFNRANGGLGSKWRGQTGGYRIVGNRVDVGQGGSIFWQPATYGPDQVACVTLTRLDPISPHHTLMLKVQQRNTVGGGAILVSYDAVRGKVTVETRNISTGGWNLVGEFTPSTPVANGDRLAARAMADGKVQVFINDALVGTATAGSFYAGKGGQIGLYFTDAYNAFLDDFGGGNAGP